MNRIIPLLLLLPFAAFGTIAIPPDFEHLVAIADTIVDATVTDVRSQKTTQDGNTIIVTRVTLSIKETLKGTPKNPYVLEMLGGTVGKETLIVDGAPQFQKEDRALFFIENNGKAAVPLVGIMFGHYWVETNPADGKASVLQPDGTPLLSTEEIDAKAARGPQALHSSQRPARSARSLSPSGVMSLDSFREEIKATLKDQP